MTFKKTLLITSIVAASFSGMANAAIGDGDGQGIIHFKGQFVDSTCTVDTNDENKGEGTVELGTWKTATFDKVGETTDAVPFTIGLVNCPSALGKARISFGGTAHSENTELHRVSDVPEVGIGISGSAVGTNFYTPNSQADEITLTDNKGTKTFYARYMTTAETVTAGNANADVTVTIQYNQ
ncbi:fimbrial protein [Providencia rettgeri]|uniref:fimbrial protein n=1 Tax=Providencia sp. TaxID=589 RepID=UPI0024ABA294|nr:fimbrial protein [Providencia rettgeri]